MQSNGGHTSTTLIEPEQTEQEVNLTASQLVRRRLTFQHLPISSKTNQVDRHQDTVRVSLTPTDA